MSADKKSITEMVVLVVFQPRGEPLLGDYHVLQHPPVRAREKIPMMYFEECPWCLNLGHFYSKYTFALTFETVI
jgi:hypothetical protein